MQAGRCSPGSWKALTAAYQCFLDATLDSATLSLQKLELENEKLRSEVNAQQFWGHPVSSSGAARRQSHAPSGPSGAANRNYRCSYGLPGNKH